MLSLNCHTSFLSGVTSKSTVLPSTCLRIQFDTTVFPFASNTTAKNKKLYYHFQTFYSLAAVIILAATTGIAKTPPNFLIVYMDDLGWADTSVKMMDSQPESRSDFYQTPNLEKLAERGMKFSNGYAPAPTCTPSRKSIQFGKTPGRLQYTFIHDVLALKRELKWKDEVSMADVLKATDKTISLSTSAKGWAARRWRPSATM